MSAELLKSETATMAQDKMDSLRVLDATIPPAGSNDQYIKFVEVHNRIMGQLDSPFDTGENILIMEETKLYKVKYKTRKEYIAAEFKGMRRQQLSNFRKAGRAARAEPGLRVCGIENLGQFIAMRGLPVNQMIEVVEQTKLENEGKLTAKNIRAIVEKRQEEAAKNLTAATSHPTGAGPAAKTAKTNSQGAKKTASKNSKLGSEGKIDTKNVNDTKAKSAESLADIDSRFQKVIDQLNQLDGEMTVFLLSKLDVDELEKVSNKLGALKQRVDEHF